MIVSVSAPSAIDTLRYLSVGFGEFPDLGDLYLNDCAIQQIGITRFRHKLVYRIEK